MLKEITSTIRTGFAASSHCFDRRCVHVPLASGRLVAHVVWMSEAPSAAGRELRALSTCDVTSIYLV
jgi:hypothetical protein